MVLSLKENNYNYDIPNELDNNQSMSFSRDSNHLVPNAQEVFISDSRIEQPSRDSRSLSSKRSHRFENNSAKKVRPSSVEFLRRAVPEDDYSFSPYYTRW